MRIKKELLVYGLAILLVASVLGTVTGIGAWVVEKDAGNAYLSGGRVADNPIEIYDWYGLNEIRNDLDADYVLMNDLDKDTDGYDELVTTEEGWVPIGAPSWVGDAFTGTFDGNGYEIRDLYINRPYESHVGFFGATYDGAEITNLGVVGADVSGAWFVGGLVGSNDGGTIGNSYATGEVSGNDAIGGLVGYNGDTVSNSYATGDVSGEEEFVGGLVGENHGKIDNSYATGEVSGNDAIGGLVGSNYGTVSNSYATGDVTGEEDIGGLVGWNRGTVENSYATGNVSGEYDVGGLVGTNHGTISDSYSISDVSGDCCVGGLLGINYGTVENSFWDIRTTGQDHSDGGTGKTTAEMIKEQTFTDAGWDFEEDWDIIEKETYPFLQWQEENTYPYPNEDYEDPVEYELTINIEGEGEVKVDGVEIEDGWLQRYVESTEVTLEAIPDDGWKFVKWTGDYEGEEEVITIVMDEDKEITALFEREEDDETLRLTTILLLGASTIVVAIIAVAIYQRKRKKRAKS